MQKIALLIDKTKILRCIPLRITLCCFLRSLHPLLTLRAILSMRFIVM